MSKPTIERRYVCADALFALSPYFPKINVVRGILHPTSAFAFEAKPAEANLACSTLPPRRANLIRATER
jgi:hypothetical protein